MTVRKRKAALRLARLPEPAEDCIIIVGADVVNGILFRIVRKVGAVAVRVKGKLRNLHSREAGICKELDNVLAERS